MADLVGQQFGTYRLIRLIGQGAFADVYLGENVSLTTKVPVAVKVMRSHLTLPKEQMIFREKTELVASLTHPHIIRILHFDVQNTVAFLVMNYAPNGSLRDLYPDGTRVDLMPYRILCNEV